MARPTKRASEGRLLCSGAGVALVAPLLAHLSLPRLESVLEPRRFPKALEGCEVQRETDRVAKVVASLIRRGRPLIRSGCLTRGITRYWLLRRSGIDVSLCFGTGTINEEFKAHCWIDHHGLPILESTDPRVRFTEIARIPGACIAG